MTNIDSLERLITDQLSCVVVALKQTEPLVQKICSRVKVPCIDITAFSVITDKMKQQLPTDSSLSVIFAGFFPGLSGIAVKESLIGFDQVDQVDVCLIQNMQANVGLTGMSDMLKIIAEPVNGGAGIVKSHPIIIKGKEYQLRNIMHDEREVLQRCLNIPKIVYHTSWNNEVFNKFMSFIVRTHSSNLMTSMMRVLKINMDKGIKDETAYLMVETKGKINNNYVKKVIQLEVFSDYGITAWMTALLVETIHNKPLLKGVLYPFEILDFNEILVLEQWRKLRFIHYDLV